MGPLGFQALGAAVAWTSARSGPDLRHSQLPSVGRGGVGAGGVKGERSEGALWPYELWRGGIKRSGDACLAHSRGQEESLRCPGERGR